MARPLSGYDLLNLAQRLELNGVELPLDIVAADGRAGGEVDGQALDAFRAAAQERGLALTLDTPPLDAGALAAHVRGAARLGARVVRTMLSTVLCGDRAPAGGLAGWQRLLEARVQVLRTVAPLAEELDIRIGVENHQDATSDELVALCRAVGSTHVGITLDTGNPLAVAEDPVRFAEKILPHLVHVHLKDYRVAATTAGYKLFHCPIGGGVVDFRALFALFGALPAFARGEIALNLEMAMLGERHIRVLEDDYWAGYAPRSVADALPVLRLRDASPRADAPEADWRTPWDLGEDDRLAAWELARLAESVETMRRVGREEEQPK